MNPEAWDRKYRESSDHAKAEAAPIVLELLPLLPLGTALDLACGAGRHAVLLASHGFHVVGVDASAEALNVAEERARAAGIKLRRKSILGTRGRESPSDGIELVQADLETTTLPTDSFDVILCVHYLQRSLFSRMERALRPGGMLVFETFTKAHLEFGAGPRNPEFLLESHELRGAFPSLRTVFFRELSAGKGIASLLAKKPA